jgi:hypothetical protein
MGKKKDTKITGPWKPGQSGNPAGRKKGSKNKITVLRQNTELALRKYLDNPRRAALAYAALDRVFDIALNGEDKEALQASKIVLDKMLPNAKAETEGDSKGSGKPIQIQIVNQTEQAAGKVVTVIEGEIADDES